jgi:hypothetical protein
MNQNNTIQTSHEKNLQHSPKQTIQHYLKFSAYMKLCHKSRTPKFTNKSLACTLNTSHNFFFKTNIIKKP